MMTNKKNGVLQSFFYKFTERITVKFIGFVISIILARILEPEVFGLLAILQVFINLSQVFVQGGLNVALVQSKDTKEDDYSTVFWISLIIAALFYAAVFMLAPFIGEYYNSTDLVAPLRVFSICMFFGAFNSVQIAKLSREMQFRSQMICNLIATLLSGIVGIILAYLGFGLWALVTYNLAQQVIVCLTMMKVANWVPQLVFSKQRAVDLFNYGWKILLSNVLYSLYIDIRTLIIGRAYSVNDVAIYDRGNQIPNIVCYNLDSAVQSVMLPVLSRHQNNIETICESLSKMIRIMTFLVTPIMIGLAAVAEPLVSVLLTDKWVACIPYMVIFCIGYVFSPVAGLCNVAIKSIGKSNIFAKSQAVRIGVLFTILIMTVFAFQSVNAIVIGYSIGLFVEMLIAVYPAYKYIGYSFRTLARDFLPNFVSSMIMGVLAYVTTLLISNDLLSLVISVIVGVFSYLMLSFVFKLRAFTEILNLIRGYKSMNKNKLKRKEIGHE